MSNKMHLWDTQVRIFQENGQHVGKSMFQVLAVDKSRMKLYKGKTIRAKEAYSSSMQVCFPTNVCSFLKEFNVL